MPLYNFTCPTGHTREAFFHRAEQAVTGAVTCECGEPMSKAFSMGRGLTYFEEGRGQWIENLADKPVYVTSHEQHKRLMRQHGVDWATERAVKGSGGWQ